MRQLDSMMKTIERARYEELETQAKLHKLKLKPFNIPLDLNSEERQKANAHAQSVFERMKKTHGARKNNG